ncbi:MAG: hypothetical protein LBO74_08245 [Candidatus Symbiothrix sp.]|jgi:hypothetical protein|nr:hypothetical protein [Candidatus Symbiothrix sp.]
MDEKVVAYIDLLAFSNHVRKNTGDAMMVFSNYNTILNSKIRNSQIYPVDSYIDELKELAKKNSIDCFEYFLPFSDSIFIVSNDINNFVTQISSFIYNCFHLTSHFYINPKDLKDPTKGDMVSFSLSEDGQINSTMIDTHYHPTIFRGGVVYGEVFPLDLWGIVDSKPQKLKSLAGKAVVRAVELESKIKGPRIVFEQNTYDQLNEVIKSRYIRKIKNTDFYEILWPAITYIPENSKSNPDFNGFHDMFVAAVNLWKAYNHTPYSEHYFCFVELIITSTIQFFTTLGYEVKAVELVRKAMKDKGLEDKIDNFDCLN